MQRTDFKTIILSVCSCYCIERLKTKKNFTQGENISNIVLILVATRTTTEHDYNSPITHVIMSKGT